MFYQHNASANVMVGSSSRVELNESVIVIVAIAHARVVTFYRNVLLIL